MISIENSSGLVIVAVAWMMVAIFSAAVRPGRRASSVVQFSTMTMVASAISPMAIASPASENRLIVWPNSVSGSAVNSVPSRSANRRDRRADVPERDADDENDDEQLVDNGLKEVRERVPDEGCAIVGRDELDARGKRRLQLLEPSPQRVGHRQHVAALLHDGDAAHDLAGAIEIGNAAAEVVAGLQVADVLEMNGLAGPVAAEHEELELPGLPASSDRAADTRGW